MGTGRIPPVRTVSWMVRLTVRLLRTTVALVIREAIVSRRDLWNGWLFPPRRWLPPAAGRFTPMVSCLEDHGGFVVVWFMGDAALNRWKTRYFMCKTKNPACLGGAGGVRKESEIPVRELPALFHGIKTFAKSAWPGGI